MAHGTFAQVNSLQSDDFAKLLASAGDQTIELVPEEIELALA